MTCLCAHVPAGMICLACALARGTVGVSFDEYGSRKEHVRITRRAICQVYECDRSMVANGYCLGHYRLYHRAKRFAGTRR